MAPFTDSRSKLHASEPHHLCQIITPVGMLGYGFDLPQTIAALEWLADENALATTALILDSGSTDSGPSKLALGSMTCPRASYHRDLGKLIRLVLKYKVPLLLSSAGGDGSDEHVDEFVDIIREIASESGNESWKLTVLAIYSQLSKEIVISKFESGQISGCGSSVPSLTLNEIDKTPRIVAQMGPEPFLQAMIANPDFNIVVGGRAYDPSPFVAYCTYITTKRVTTSILDLGSQKLGAFMHMGKIMECGGLCAIPKGGGATACVNTDNSFDIKPMNPSARCSPLSIAAHTLYEKSQPDILHGPGGFLDLREAGYEQLADGVSVRVRGSVFTSSQEESLPYTVKLEGAKVSGYRTLIMGAFRDPILIPQTYAFLESVKHFVSLQHAHITDPWSIHFHVYGLDADLSTTRDPANMPREVFIVGETIAGSQALATSLASSARVNCVHGPYPGQKATSGNLAMGIGGKFELETAECAEFSIYHLMTLERGEEGAKSAMAAGILASDSGASPELFTWKSFCIGDGNGSPSEDTDRPACTPSEKKIPIPKKPSAVSSTSPPTTRPRTLVDIAQIIRSKNAGPYEITLDIIFSDASVYALVKASGILSPELIGRLYETAVEEIIWCGFFDVALAFKATLPRIRNGRPACSGGFAEEDVHGSQQYVRLMETVLPEGLVKDLMEYWKIPADN